MVNTIHGEVKDNIINKLNKEDYDNIINTDADFYYLAGQCTKYMADRYIKMFMTGKIRENQVSKFILTSKNFEQLKENLKKMLIGKCSNLIFLDKDRKFNNVFATLINYNPADNKINKDFLELGYLETNIL